MNTLSALGIGAFLLAFLKRVVGKAWSGRQSIVAWIALAFAAFLSLEAIRFNTIAYKQSVLTSTQSSLDQINKHYPATADRRANCRI